MNTTNTYNYADAPTSFCKCLAEECTAAAQCLRYQAARALMEHKDQLWVLSPMYIRPTDGEKCPYFQSIKPICVARGFKRALGSVRTDKVKAAITALISLHSRRTYYRMRNGEIALDADEQKKVADILTKYGAEQPIVFDAYEEVAAW